jgi:hypothetical protein
MELGWGYHLIFSPWGKTFIFQRNYSKNYSTKQLGVSHHLIPLSPKKLFLRELD